MRLNTKEIAIFGMLGAAMYASKIIMDLAPNIHLIGVFIVATTIVYRKKALYPLYIFVLLTGLFGGFAMWWIPYIYIWAVLWCFAMLIPEKARTLIKDYANGVQTSKRKIRRIGLLCMCICAFHGYIYGLLYAPMQAVMFGLSFKGMIAWIVAGIPFDLIHGTSNFFCGMLILPIVKILYMAEKYTGRTDWY